MRSRLDWCQHGLQNQKSVIEFPVTVAAKEDEIFWIIYCIYLI